MPVRLKECRDEGYTELAFTEADGRSHFLFIRSHWNEDNDRATVGTAMSLDKSLQANHQFAEIEWFSDDERMDGLRGGAVHPY